MALIPCGLGHGFPSVAPISTVQDSSTILSCPPEGPSLASSGKAGGTAVYLQDTDSGAWAWPSPQ